MSSIKLLGDRVLISADKAEVKRDSGLILSKENGQADIQSGVVEVVGTGKFLENGSLAVVDVKVGDKVMFQYGVKVEVDGKQLLMVNGSDIILVVN